MKNLNKISLKSIDFDFNKLWQSLAYIADFKEKAVELIKLMAQNRLLIVFSDNWHYQEIDSPDDYDNLSIIWIRKNNLDHIEWVTISYWNKEYDYDNISFDQVFFTIPNTYLKDGNQEDILKIIKDDVKLKMENAALKREELEKKYKEEMRLLAEERKVQAEINEKKEFLRLQKKFWKKEKEV